MKKNIKSKAHKTAKAGITEIKIIYASIVCA